MPEFSASIALPRPPQIVREFLGTTANLPDLADPELELEIITAPEQVHSGAEIEFRISAFGFKHRLKNRFLEVTELQIVEEQIEGPMKAWQQVQLIEVGDDEHSCRLTDTITFIPPGGMMGFMLTEEKIRESIESGLGHKHSFLGGMFA